MQSFDRFRRQGVNMSIGTDTFLPDMIENIKVGSMLAQYIDGNKIENSLFSYYEAVTLSGARALGRKDLGKIVVGSFWDPLVCPST